MKNLKNKLRIKEHNRVKFFFLISALLHLTFLLSKFENFLSTKSEQDRNRKKLLSIQKPLELIDKNSLFLKNLKQKIDEKNRIKQKMQIVNNEIVSPEKKSVTAKFLGEKDQSFDKQTVAKEVGIFKAAGKGDKDGDKSDKLTKIEESKRAEKSKIKNFDLANKNNQSKKNIVKNIDFKNLKLSDLSLGKNQINDLKSDLEKASEKEKEMLKNQGIENGDKNSLGFAKNNDYIEDVPLGEMTNLNTIQFKYFGFYARIRKKLEQYWGYSLRKKAEKLYKEGKTFSSDNNYITSLKIAIDEKGNIIKVIILSTSGNTDLDEAAIESFNKAGPFPNPPKGMLENGIAVIEWGFIVRG